MQLRILIILQFNVCRICTYVILTVCGAEFRYSNSQQYFSLEAYCYFARSVFALMF
jgi:hypothetical protein